MNIGVRPTVTGKVPAAGADPWESRRDRDKHVEVHLLGEVEDLYGRDVEVIFLTAFAPNSGSQTSTSWWRRSGGTRRPSAPGSRSAERVVDARRPAA